MPKTTKETTKKAAVKKTAAKKTVSKAKAAEAKTTKKACCKKVCKTASKKAAVKETAPEIPSAIPVSPLSFERPAKFNQVKHPLEKIDALGLVCGVQEYVQDVNMRNMLHIKILGSPHPHARIKDIDISEAEKMPGVVAVYTYKNVYTNGLKKVARTTAGQGWPEPSPYDTYLLDSKVRFVGDRVAIVAAETEQIAADACRKIKVKYEILEPVFDPEHAMDEGAPVIHDEPEAYMYSPIFYDPTHNHCSHVEAKVGDVEKGFKEADVVLERKYFPHFAQHCPMEPHVCIAWLDGNDRLVLRTSTQVPFHSRRITAQTLGIPIKKIRVIKPRVGGAFGAKQEVLLEDVCGLVAMRTRRPCKLVLTRPEEFRESRVRHPMVVNVKMGCKKDGTMTALSLRIISNTGAYGSHALTVLSNCGSKVLPLYLAENMEFIGDTVYTNLPVGGAYRGYGATQAVFGTESMMDEMAEALGLDPIEFRKKTHIQEGGTSPIFKALGEGREGVDMAITSCGLDEAIDRGMKKIGWAQKYGKHGKGTKRRGLGMCCLMQGSSIPEVDMGSIFIKMNEDGSFNMLLGATDLGTGSDTVLAQIAAETLGCDLKDIIVYSSDTDMTPFDVGAYASSTTYLTGGAAITTAKKVREQIVAVAALKMGEKVEDITIEKGVCYGKDKKQSTTFGEICRYAMYENKQFQIGAIGSHISHASPPPFAAHFAEVEVDTETGQVELLQYVAGCDCGTAINPQLAEGQIEGGCMNGISYALTEEYIFDNGRMLNDTFANFKIWTMRDMPKLDCFLVDTYEPTGPYGAKSVSEVNINGALPAIANAIYNAVGVRLTKPPFTAEKVWRGMQELKKNADKKGKGCRK